MPTIPFGRPALAVCVALGLLSLSSCSSSERKRNNDSELPRGYQQIDYSLLEPDPKVKGGVPSTALELKDKNVYIRGYIIPPGRGRMTGLTKFSICRNSDMCKFGMNLARPEDQIHVELTGDREVNYVSYQIGVGGKFSLPDDRSPQPYYLIEADYIHQ